MAVAAKLRRPNRKEEIVVTPKTVGILMVFLVVWIVLIPIGNEAVEYECRGYQVQYHYQDCQY